MTRKIAIRSEDGQTTFTEHQWKFIYNYLNHYDYKRAHKEAGYENGGNVKYALKVFTDLRPKIQELMREQLGTPEEIVQRFLDMVRFDPSQYFKQNGSFDLPKIKADGLGWMIKSISSKESMQGTKLVHTYSVEFHDGQKALNSLARIYGLDKGLTVNVNVRSKGYSEVSPDDWDAIPDKAISVDFEHIIDVDSQEVLKDENENLLDASGGNN